MAYGTTKVDHCENLNSQDTICFSPGIILGMGSSSEGQALHCSISHVQLVTHCNLMMPYGSTLAQVWLGAWRQQAITWANVDSSIIKGVHGNHLKAIWQEVFMNFICNMFRYYTFKITTTFQGCQWVKTLMDMFLLNEQCCYISRQQLSAPSYHEYVVHLHKSWCKLAGPRCGGLVH